MTEIKGIDVSHYQGDIDYGKVKAAGYQFVIVKATEGSEAGSRIIDPYFKKNVADAKAAGLSVHAYHFFRGVSESDARAEADWLLKNLTGDEQYLFCDVEATSLNNDSSKLTTFVNAFFDQLANAGHTKLGIYTGFVFIKSRIIESKLRPGLLKWLARYNDTLGRDADIWQHTSVAKVPGITGNVDENIAYTDAVIGPDTGAVKPDNKPEIASKPASAGIILKKGDIGAAVKALQTKLASVYFYPDKPAPNHGIDGVYGPKTADAVRRFQIVHKLTADGIYGPQTASALNDAINKKPAASKPVSRPTHIVKAGENLTIIAKNNHTTVVALAKINHLANPDKLSVGQKLYLK